VKCIILVLVYFGISKLVLNSNTIDVASNDNDNDDNDDNDDDNDDIYTYSG
jgi:hypothetical protein